MSSRNPAGMWQEFYFPPGMLPYMAFWINPTRKTYVIFLLVVEILNFENFANRNSELRTRCVMKHKCPRMRQILEVAINV
jgi:hypothetical protein